MAKISTFYGNLLPVPTTISSRGRLLDISEPVVMGILNATPNSFYNKGRDSHVTALTEKAMQMVADGATILDVGGASTKPGEPVSLPEHDLERIAPVITAIRQALPGVWLSVDTYHARVAEEAVHLGADIINDVSSGAIDSRMLAAVGKLKVPYIAMHMQGLPENMQLSPTYGNVVMEVLDYLQRVAGQCAIHGITDVIVDPGFGFGKTTEHNFQLLAALRDMRITGRPVLAGLSRKSIVCKPLHVNPENALNGTTALHMVALQQGASILRVHDVKEAMQVIQLHKMLRDCAG
jgi:dihydropteroate synthase